MNTEDKGMPEEKETYSIEFSMDNLTKEQYDHYMNEFKEAGLKPTGRALSQPSTGELVYVRCENRCVTPYGHSIKVEGVYYKPVPSSLLTNDDVVINAIIKELEWMIEHGEGAKDSDHTGDEILYSLNDFGFDLEQRIKTWKKKLKSLPSQTDSKQK